MSEDSGLSIAANVAGLLTFAFAVLGTIWLRVNQLRGFEQEKRRAVELHGWMKDQFLASYTQAAAIFRISPFDDFRADEREEVLEKLKTQKRAALIERTALVMNMMEAHEMIILKIPRLSDHATLAQKRKTTLGTRLSHLMREPLKMSKLRDSLAKAEAARGRLVLSDLRILRLQMSENEVTAALDQAMLKEMRDLLTEVRESRNTGSVPTATVNCDDTTDSSNSGAKQDPVTEVETGDIALQRSHNIDSLITNADTQGPVNAIDSGPPSIPVEAENI